MGRLAVALVLIAGFTTPLVADPGPWTDWRNSAGDVFVQYRYRLETRFSDGTCDWRFEMTNRHGVKVDIHYGASAGIDDGKPYDHNALGINPGQTTAAILTLNGCANVFFGAKGIPSTF
ncbi:hypothetical protein SAMN05444167_0547 [Terriglobus roseus]|uniref:Uncharacterized protein n=1 Tax=Terriglobus roseus TaxID=392734 RepID=A0A1G7G4B5_9BACT|nr:hypothetical protein SAMN05444167_0547 [Terriglobus roseus]